MTLSDLLAATIKRHFPDADQATLVRAAHAVFEALRQQGLINTGTARTDAEYWDNLFVLQGTHIARSLRSLDTITSLPEVEFKAFSQGGEDGILEWLISRLPGIPQSFVEFGVEDYREANTRFLLRHRNWRGLIMDGSDANIARAKQQSLYWLHDLKAVAAFIDRDNINHLLRQNGFEGEIGVLSIDIDGNDYWVWQAINCVNPWLVVAEYNAVLGDLQPITIPYDRTFERTRAHPSNLFWGASIAAFEHLASERGYTLVGSNRIGHNAFFVRNDVVPAVRVADRSPLPSLYRESRGPNNELTFLSGLARRDAIASMSVWHIAREVFAPIDSLGEIYSDRWKRIMGV